MRRLLQSMILLFCLATCHSQELISRGEFATNANGLMYSDSDMKALRFIVDSLNLRYKSCDLDKNYYSCRQGKIFFIRFESASNDLKDIINSIKRNVDFHSLLKNYSTFVKEVDTVSIAIRGQESEDNSFIFFKGTPDKGYSEFQSKVLERDYNKNRKWDYKYSQKDKENKEYTLDCFYLPETLTSNIIPEKYARLIQYVDCMIDTNATVFLTDRTDEGLWSENESVKWTNLKGILDYLDKMMKTKNNNNSTKRSISDEQIKFVYNKLSNDAAFKKILSETIDSYVNNKTQHRQLEEIAIKLEMYDKALLMKRSYTVVGFCSQDASPRNHARTIATLAAQSHSWDIFLRAHLDIMNDRFERRSDGSYAYGARQTYLKELEELNLNIIDLVLGLILRAENVADNHYYGTIWRMGRALSESREKERFEQAAFAMMRDERLDEFNRGLVYMLYTTYIHYLDDPQTQQKIDFLRNNILTFPPFIQLSINKLKDIKGKK